MLTALGSISLALACRFKSGGVIVNEHTLTQEETRRHVEALGRFLEFIHLNDLPERLDRRGKKPFCLLTFDDGKRSNATEVAPELRKLGVPAVFFVVTGFLDSDRPLWFDRYAALRAKLGTAPFGLGPSVIKQLPYDVLVKRVERACSRYGVDADIDNDDVRAMSWEDARTLHRHGFNIGAHGVTHAILPRQTRAAAFENIAGSIARVSTEIGAPCTAFAFPNGNYTAELAQHALRCGVKTVMTTEPMWADRILPLWRLPRLQLCRFHNPGKIHLKTALAATGCVLPNPDGTGRIYRMIHRLSRRTPLAGSSEYLSLSPEQTEAAANSAVRLHS